MFYGEVLDMHPCLGNFCIMFDFLQGEHVENIALTYGSKTTIAVDTSRVVLVETIPSSGSVARASDS